MNLHVRPGFYRDIAREELWLLKRAGAEIADRWHEAVFETLQFLTTAPEIGRERRDLRHPGIRSWRVKGFRRWLVFYEADANAVIAHRVVQGERDLPRLRF